VGGIGEMTDAKVEKYDYPKLYKVTLTGLMNYRISYVIAGNLDEAYKKVRQYLDQRDYGLRQERALKCIELLAEDYEYTDINRLWR
jgi:hypothetical protein